MRAVCEPEVGNCMPWACVLYHLLPSALPQGPGTSQDLVAAVFLFVERLSFLWSVALGPMDLDGVSGTCPALHQCCPLGDFSL